MAALQRRLLREIKHPLVLLHERNFGVFATQRGSDQHPATFGSCLIKKDYINPRNETYTNPARFRKLNLLKCFVESPGVWALVWKKKQGLQRRAWCSSHMDGWSQGFFHLPMGAMGRGVGPHTQNIALASPRKGSSS